MDDLRLDAVAARVVAWHNRHPLARRITAAHVHSIGHVALPYLATPGAAAPAPDPAAGAGPTAGSLRERALARAQAEPVAPTADPPPAAPGRAPASGTPLRAAFSEDFISPWSPRDVAKWAAAHGCTRISSPLDGPVRSISADTKLSPSEDAVQRLYVFTAQLEVGARRVRVLVGATPPFDVLGRRLWSLPRLGGAGTGLSLTLAGALVFMGRTVPAPNAAAPIAAAASASAGASLVAALPAASAPPASAPVARAAPASASAAAGALAQALQAPVGALAAPPTPPTPAAIEPATAAASVPDAQPQWGRVQLPSLGPFFDDPLRATARARRLEKQAALAAVPPSNVGGGQPAPATASFQAEAGTRSRAAAAPARPAALPAALPGAQPGFALTTRPLRTRAESEQWMSAVRALLERGAGPGLQVQLMPEGEDWRVVAWPFETQALAERARAALNTRGMRMEVLVF